MIVHQMLPNFSMGDAIGDDTRALRRILQNLGHESRIFAGVIHPYLVDEALHWERYDRYSSPDNILIYHFSVGSEIADYILTIPDKLILVYHNITPPHWFFGVSPHMVELAVEGIRQLEMLRPRAAAAWADSEYNERFLKKMGYENTAVLPIIIDFEKFSRAPNPVFSRQYRSSLTTWFFAGRMSPNKCHEDIVKSFAMFNTFIEPHSRLILTGDVRNCPAYSAAIRKLIDDMHVPNVFITGMVDDDELISLFKMADVFVCMSEHEGFCVPLLEAMYFDVPVIAYAAGAVPSTLGGAGVMVHRKDHKMIAEIAGMLTADETFRRAVVTRQRQRLDAYRTMNLTLQVKRLLEALSL